MSAAGLPEALEHRSQQVSQNYWFSAVGWRLVTGYTGQAGKLTARQREVLALLRQDPRPTYSQIAARLGITTHTVKQHVRVIGLRMAERSALQQVNAGRRSGARS